MSKNPDSSTSVVTAGGRAGNHPPAAVHDVLVGPSTNGEFNTVELDFAPEACVRFDDVRFEFDSSFIGPEAKTELKLLGKMMKEGPERPASIFGHADPTGDDDYNKILSGRRAQAMYGLLTRKTELWEDLFKHPQGGDDWGIRSIQTMLKTLGHYSGPINGTLDTPTRDAVKAFQGSPEGAGLTVDGDPGPNTRPKLYKAYMDRICVDDADQPFQLDPAKNFLAGGADAGGKGDFQGCSEFNPDLVFSQDETNRFKNPANKAERDRENKPNRRVVVYLFRKGSKISPASWPCPRAKEGVAACRKRFFSDGEKRRTPTATRRLFETTKDTFACRFYDRIGTLSPCESPPPPPPAVTATLEIVFDQNNNLAVEAGDPVTTFTRAGLWDRAFDAATGNLRNNAAEANNFVGADTRRCYFRVSDSGASGEVQVRWRTTFGAGGNDDAPASQVITLTETGAGTHLFVSRAVMIVTDNVDRGQATDSGLPAGNADAGSRNQGQSNHRIRRITVDNTHRLDSVLTAEYTPSSGAAALTANAFVFNRSPEERKLMRVHLVNVRSAAGATPPAAGALTAATRDLVTRTFHSIYARCGIFVEVDEIMLDPPASCVGWPTRYPTDPIAVNPAVEGFTFDGVNLLPSASQTDLINAVRALPSFDANDIYIVCVARVYSAPVPAPPGPGLTAGGGEAFPDSWTAAGSAARSFAFIGAASGVTEYGFVHEATHITTDLRNVAGGHFDLGGAAATTPGNVEGKNLMHRFFLTNTGGVSDPKRLWNEQFTNSNRSPAMVVPAQIDAIRGSRFIRNLP